MVSWGRVKVVMMGTKTPRTTATPVSRQAAAMGSFKRANCATTATAKIRMNVQVTVRQRFAAMVSFGLDAKRAMTAIPTQPTRAPAAVKAPYAATAFYAEI